MLSVQPGCKYCKNRKLRAICIFPSVRHVNPTSTIMIQSEVLVVKSFTINTFPCHSKGNKCLQTLRKPDSFPSFIIHTTERKYFHYSSYPRFKLEPKICTKFLFYSDWLLIVLGDHNKWYNLALNLPPRPFPCVKSPPM